MHSFQNKQKGQIGHDAILYKKRHKIGNMSGHTKDWRRVVMRFDRRADIVFPARALAATVLFWLWVLSLGAGQVKVWILSGCTGCGVNNGRIKDGGV